MKKLLQIFVLGFVLATDVLSANENVIPPFDQLMDVVQCVVSNLYRADPVFSERGLTQSWIFEVRDLGSPQNYSMFILPKSHLTQYLKHILRTFKGATYVYLYILK